MNMTTDKQQRSSDVHQDMVCSKNTADDVCTHPTFVCISKSSGESISREEISSMLANVARFPQKYDLLCCNCCGFLLHLRNR